MFRVNAYHRGQKSVVVFPILYLSVYKKRTQTLRITSKFLKRCAKCELESILTEQEYRS